MCTVRLFSPEEDRVRKIGESEYPDREDCIRVLKYAAGESEYLRHQHIGPGNILAGLLQEEKCFASRFLRQHGFSQDA